jgi:nucleoid-associated protein YgaU
MPLESLLFQTQTLIRRPISAYLGKSCVFAGLPPRQGLIMQKKPLALFSGIAAAGVLALAITTITPPQFATDTAQKDVVEPKTPETVVTAKPAVEPKPVEQVAKAQEPKPEAAPQPKLPSFDTVRVDASGDAVIAGRAEPGAAVAVKFNGQIVGEGVANAAGEFAIVPDKKLEQGTGALTLVMTKNGAITESEGSVVVSLKEDTPVMVAKVDPVEPTNVTQVPAEEIGPAPKDVQLNAVDYDSAGNIVFTGRAAPGSAIRFYVDNKLAGEAQADSTGRWIFKGGETVPAGQHTLRADQIDANGKVLSRIELPFMRETEATVAATQPPVVEAPVVEPPTQIAAVQTVPETPVAVPEAKTEAKLTESQQVVPSRIVIQPGHNLWKLSRQIYGRGKLYTVIYQANKDQLRSPHRIYPGQILTAPIQKATN